MLPFKTRRTSQPQDAIEIDRSNPLSQSLLRSYDFSNGGMDAADLGVSRWNTGGLSESISRAGRGLRVNAQNTLSSSESLYPYISTGVTIILLAEKHAAITGASNFIFGETTTADAVNFNWGLYESVSTGNLSCFLKNAGGTSVNTPGGTAWVAGAGPQVWAMTYGDGDNFLRLYLNGVQVGAVAQTGLIQKNASSLVQSASWNTGATSFPNFSLIKADVFARNIGAAQVKALSDNPWQLFKPVSRSLWIPGTVSGGGPATVIPIGQQATGSVGTLVATGAAKGLPAGVSASSAVGTPVAVGGSSIPATVTPAGVSATGSVGTATATGQAKAYPAGVSATASVGSPVALAGGAAVATPAGVQAVGAVGNLIATGAAWCVPGGVSASGAVGTPVASGGAAVAAVAYPVGLVGYWSVGTPTINTTGIDTVSGAAARPSRLQVSNRAPRYQTGARHAR